MVDNKDLTVNFLPSPTWNRLGVNRAKIRSIPVDGWNSIPAETAAGRRRLRKVAKVCVDYGQRVQNSVFECLLDAAQYTMFKAKLTELIDSESDSLRFYQLGNHYKSKVEHVGLHPDFDQDGILFA